MINDQFGYRPCPKCKGKTFYNERYDSNYCKACNIWLEDNCGDTDCFYCASRPEKPVSCIDTNLCQEKFDMNLRQLADLSNEFGHIDDKLHDRLYPLSNKLSSLWPEFFKHEE